MIAIISKGGKSVEHRELDFDGIGSFGGLLIDAVAIFVLEKRARRGKSEK